MSKHTSWRFSPELDRQIDRFFDDNVDTTLDRPISFFPTEGMASYTEGGVYHIETEVPGMSKDNLEVTYNEYDGYLMVEGKVKSRGGYKTVKKTIYVGKELEGGMNASLKDGILTVSFPKMENAKRTARKVIKIT